MFGIFIGNCSIMIWSSYFNSFFILSERCYLPLYFYSYATAV